MGYVLKSPDMLLQQAADVLDGRSIANDAWRTWPPEYWSLVINVWGANLPKELAQQEIRLLCTIYDIPISEGEVAEIVAFQLIRR